MDGPPGDDSGPLPPPPLIIDFLPPAEAVLGDINWTVALNTEINTTTGSILPLGPVDVTFKMAMQRDGNSSAMILRVKRLSVATGVTLTATGTRPLFILADDVTIDGTLDVGAHGATPGPGGATGGMGAGAGMVSQNDNTGTIKGNSGGGGGSFGSKGAAGGNVGTASSGAGEPYAIGAALVAGASGGGAGVCINPPGAGGGALLIYAKSRIVINGAISAGGGGGAGGLFSCGTTLGAGSGGGSGGAIWLQTPNLGGTGILAANGGGGGGGGSHTPTNIDGGNGSDGKASVSELATGGLAPADDTSAGGSGAIEGRVPSVVPTLNRNGDSNGGGGGGGLGRIVYRAPGLGGLQSSPTAVAAPK